MVSIKSFNNKLRVKWIGVVVVIISIYSCNAIRSIGKNPAGNDLEMIEALPNYKDGAFQNRYQGYQLKDTSPQKRKPRWLSLLKFFTGQPKELLPSKTLIAVDTDLINTKFPKPTVIWFGHSSFLLKTSTANILVDPSFSGFAGPFKGAIKAFKGSNVYDESDMPEIDALVISHDHYDHLDYVTVNRLREKIKKVIVPIGVGSHFRYWGFPPEIITEVNWNDSIQIDAHLTIFATPAHHRSNRTLETRKTLWASYVFRADGYKIFFSGDTGYSQHFSDIGKRYGPFDLAMMECGQYNLKWPQSHMFPAQTARAAKDVGAAMTIPIHWGKYAESEHAWNEPVNLFTRAADSLNVPYVVPFIGLPYTVGGEWKIPDWWNHF